MNEDNIQPPEKDEDTAQKNQQSEGQPPATVTSVNVAEEHAEEHSGNPNNNKRKRKRKPLSYFEIWTIILASLGILMAAGTGAAIFWQARISNWTLDEIKKGGTDTHDLAVQAKNQADKMKDISDAAGKIRQAADGMFTQEKRLADDTDKSMKANNTQSQKALDATIAAAHLEQRAWVAAIVVEMDGIESGKPINGYVAWLNSGKTFAKKVTPSCHFTTIPGPITNQAMLARLAVPAIEEQSIGVLTPGAQYRTILKGQASIPQIERNSMASTSAPWYTYVWGEMTYEDIFGKSHTTIFCDTRRGVSGDFIQCPFYNDAN